MSFFKNYLLYNFTNSQFLSTSDVGSIINKHYKGIGDFRHQERKPEMVCLLQFIGTIILKSRNPSLQYYQCDCSFFKNPPD